MDNSLHSLLRENLSQQLSEYELIKSMYPLNDDIIITEMEVLQDMKRYIDGESDVLPGHLDYVVNLRVDNYKMEVFFTLPSFYPSAEEPDVCVRCNQMSRYQETNLNTELRNFVNNSFENEVFIYSILSWLLEYKCVDEVINSSTEPNLNVENNPELEEEREYFSRYWIYSHHIYNKRKREEVLTTAKDLKLTGFCLPGKPGIICVEGEDKSCNGWWKHIKNLTWQKISLKKCEKFTDSKERRFNSFKEIQLPNSSKNCRHADMGEFNKYLISNGLGHIFNELFGLCSV